MKKTVLLVLFTAFFIMLIGSCVRDIDREPLDKDNIVTMPEIGKYKLTEMKRGDDTNSDDVLDYMEKHMNQICTIDLHDDGTGELLLFDETRDFTWDHRSFTIISGNDNISYTYKNGTLTFTSRGVTLVFTKVGD